MMKWDCLEVIHDKLVVKLKLSYLVVLFVESLRSLGNLCVILYLHISPYRYFVKAFQFHNIMCLYRSIFSMFQV